MVGLALTVAVVTAGTAGQLVDYGFNLHVAVLESSGDGGLLGVASDVALVAAALAAWVVFAQARPATVATVALPVLLTFLVFESLAPVAVVTFIALVAVAQRLPRQSWTMLHAALVLLATAFLLHAGGGTALDVFGAAGDGWAHQLESVIKHGAETGGWMLVAIGLAAGWRSR